MPASIYDIAKAAGVSAATVSNVLNERGRFSEKTRDLVLKVADELGYMPNLSARGLREQRTNTIGIVTPDVSNDFFSSMVLNVERAMHERGYTSFICNTWYRGTDNADYLAELKQRNVDGIFIVGSEPIGDFSVLGSIPCALVDFVYLNRPKRYVSVENDNSRIVADQVELLFEKGCTHPLLLTFDIGEKGSPEDYAYASFTAALRRAGIADPDSHIVTLPHNKSSREEAEDYVNALLDEGREFDGIVCIGDRVALGACQALLGRGILPGGEVKVIGMDNSLYSKLGYLGISTVDRGTDEMVERAVEGMMQMLASEEPAERDVVIPHRIIERETT